METKNDYEEIFKLSEGFSNHASTSNKIWLVLALVSILSIMPRTVIENENEDPSSIKEQKIELPFELGKVNSRDFYPFSTLLISILLIGFSSAYIQGMRTRLLIHYAIKKRHKDNLFNGIHIQDIVDNTIGSTFNRISPIAEFVKGKGQFKSFSPPNKWCNNISTILYIILSIVSYFVLYYIPYLGLKESIIKTIPVIKVERIWGLSALFYWVFAIIAMLVFLSAFILDLNYKRIAIQSYFKKT
jgi:hypothetical protein